MKKENILFENKVFSTNPNSLGLSSYLEEDTMHLRDDEIYVPIEELNELYPKFFYYYDPVETYFRNERLKYRTIQKTNLLFAKKVIADEHYPEDGEHWYGPVVSSADTQFDPEEDEVIYTEVFVWGRRYLLDMIAICRYSNAIPELREIILHDDSYFMRRKALRCLGVMEPEKTDPIIKELLECTTDREMIMEILNFISARAPRTIFLRTLHEKLEEYYLDYIESALGRRYFRTIPQMIMMICGKIPASESLEILEKGIQHPYPHVEHNAKYAMVRCLEKIGEMKDVDEKLFKLSCKMSKKYNFLSYESAAWKVFPKLPIAGPH